jgi:ribosomal protein S18 acetylase RimI-like enzyme
VTDPQQQPIGTLILGKHQPLPDPEADELAQPIIEIVYMGLRPSARGKSYGRELVKYAFAIAKQLESARLILAVDQQNSPALAIYESFHFRSIMSETVWAKSISA